MILKLSQENARTLDLLQHQPMNNLFAHLTSCTLQPGSDLWNSVLSLKPKAQIKVQDKANRTYFGILSLETKQHKTKKSRKTASRLTIEMHWK